MKLLKQFIQQETVLTAAAVLAVVSAFFVLPDAQYLGYIDLRTLAILFSLMTVMAGLRRQGFFDGQPTRGQSAWRMTAKQLNSTRTGSSSLSPS